MINRIKSIPRDIMLFLGTMACVGFGESVVNSTFNNYLNDTFSLNSFQRTFLEIPRELPGFLIIFVSALLFFIRTRRLAVFSTLLCFAGMVFISFFSFNFTIMFFWLFIYSLGQHLFMPLNSSIGMELAQEGKTGKRLGDLYSVRNFATIIGSLAVMIGFRFFKFNFTISFMMAAGVYLIASMLLYSMQPGKSHPPAVHLKLHKEYRLYYWLSILFGTRKQIFLTFAPWVLVTVYKKPTATVAFLFFIGGIAGVVFQPILGRSIDRFGEKVILTIEAVLLIFVCAGYGFSKNIFSESTAFIIAAICFIMDQLLMTVSIARATYMSKIAVHPDHITPTLTMSVSIDHFFSIAVAIAGGLMWLKFGYQSVFLFGAIIAVINLLSALQIKIPLNNKAADI